MLLRYGSTGMQVQALQAQLNRLGFDAGAEDGLFFKKTKAAVIRAQAQYGLFQDGIVGPNTQGALDAHEKGEEKPVETVIHGMDVSHHNGVIDFNAWRAKGVRFCWIKATEGDDYVDAMHERNYVAAVNAGMYTGFYHFFRSNKDPEVQLNHFMKTVGEAHGKLKCVNDWETSDGMSIAVRKQRALEFSKGLQEKAGGVVLYGSPGFLGDMGDMSDFDFCTLWTAHYGVEHPKIIAPWSHMPDITHPFWQYTDQAGMDLDLFFGSEEELKKFII